MSFIRTILVILCLVPVASAADLATLDGRKIAGDIVSIVGSDLTFKGPSGEEKFLVTTLHSITTGPAPKPIALGTKHTTVELVDGTLFRCSEIVIKGKTIEMKLLGPSARTVTMPMRPSVFAINREAGDAKFEQDFRGLLRGRGRYDLWITKRQVKNDAGKEIDELDGVPGTFGDGNAADETIEFKFETRQGRHQGKPSAHEQGVRFDLQPEGAGGPPAPPGHL